MMEGSRFVRGRQIVELRVTLGRTGSMPSPDAAARHTGAGVARRQAHHERMRDERAREAAAGNAELPPEDDAVEMASAAQLLDSVAEAGPNYTLLRSKGDDRRSGYLENPGYTWKIPGMLPVFSVSPQILPQTSSQTHSLSSQGNSRVGCQKEWSSKLSGFPWKFPETKSAGDPLVFLVPETCTFSNVYLLWEKLFRSTPVSDIGERLDGATH